MNRALFACAAFVLTIAVTVLAPAAARAAAGAPLASAPTNWDGISIDLMSVERKGSVLTVKWAVKNEGAKEKEVSFPLEGQQVTTYLLDEESGTKYYALTDKETNVVASQSVYCGNGSKGIQETVPAGQSRRYWAKFPAPPAAVKTINLLFTNTEPLEGVPITDK